MTDGARLTCAEGASCSCTKYHCKGQAYIPRSRHGLVAAAAPAGKAVRRSAVCWQRQQSSQLPMNREQRGLVALGWHQFSDIKDASKPQVGSGPILRPLASYC